MRVFICFDLSVPTVNNLVLLQEELREPIVELGGKVRWTPPENIHLTLKFLGETDDDMVFQIRSKLRDVAKQHPMVEAETVGTGAFPNAKVPRIIWVGTGTGSDAIITLQQNIETSLETLGIQKDDRSFKPHLTIGRIKTRKQRVNLEPILLPHSDKTFGVSLVKDFALYRSVLHPRGAIYQVIERFPLTG